MTHHEAEEALEGAGFTAEQIGALLEIFARHPHEHEMDDIIGLEQELAELEFAGDEEEE
jgi:hypothetical protein